MIDSSIDLRQPEPLINSEQTADNISVSPSIANALVSGCTCTDTQGHEGEKGSWCVKCGKKVMDVESRPCKECKYHKRDIHGSSCSKLLMSVYPEMHVTYKVDEGTCFEVTV